MFFNTYEERNLPIFAIPKIEIKKYGKEEEDDNSLGEDEEDTGPRKLQRRVRFEKWAAEDLQHRIAHSRGQYTLVMMLMLALRVIYNLKYLQSLD